MLVSEGDGFAPAAVGSELRAGTQVMVRPGGSAVIRYGGGCEQSIGPGRVWIIEDTPPCGRGPPAGALRSAGSAGRASGEAGPPVEEPGVPAGALVTGGLLAAGGAAAAVLLLGGDGGSEKPSPLSP